ncbi:hypothetical protein LZC95_02765 [Pendulispora brunnea]|uniref:Metalloprotease n=1 Tax=Pendulispora brunnea TaxID=2905690 RepID=A0ABZ2KAQ4_9BACT
MNKGLYRTALRSVAGVGAVFAIGLSSTSATGGPVQLDVFVPPNDLHLQDGLFNSGGLTKEQFDGVIAQTSSIFTPVVAGHNGTLVVNSLWDNSTVNASASRNGSSWIVNMYGGLARRPEVTPEGFTLVLCHELGHHLGGYVFKRDDWAAAEGQSDWFATQICARRIWKDDAAGNAAFRTSAPQILRDKCDAQWATAEEQNLCYRIGSGGISLGALLATLSGETVDISTPDTTVVTATNYRSYPGAQCRLDTYITGALCGVQGDLSVIPGVNSAAPKNNVESEREAAKYRCLPSSTGVPGYNGKDVPTCWFKALIPAAQ